MVRVELNRFMPGAAIDPGEEISPAVQDMDNKGIQVPQDEEECRQLNQAPPALPHQLPLAQPVEQNGHGGGKEEVGDLMDIKPLGRHMNLGGRRLIGNPQEQSHHPEKG